MPYRRENNTVEVLNPMEQIITRFSIVCKPYRRSGERILTAIQRYLYWCPHYVYTWLVDVDQKTINDIVRRAVHAPDESKVWREINRTFHGKSGLPINPAYL